MKKTIAILLVLVIAGVGLFAAISGSETSSTLGIKTEVIGLQHIALTSAAGGLNSATNVSNWNNFLSTYGITEDVAVTTSSSTVGYLNILNNKKAGIEVTMAPGTMTAQDENNTYIMDYTIACQDANLTTVDGAVSAAVAVKPENTVKTNGLFIKGYEITASLDQTDYDNAPADNYRADITFTFTNSN